MTATESAVASCWAFVLSDLKSLLETGKSFAGS
jgi:hypothetical protein